MGAVFASLTLYSRTKIAETPRYTAQVANQRAKANADLEKMNRAEEIPEEVPHEQQNNSGDLSFWQFAAKYRNQIIGCSMCWFLLDVAFYSQGLFQSQVFLQTGYLPPAKNMYALQETASIAKAQSIIALGSTIPGYWFTVFTVDTLGRKFIQLMGFIMMTLFMGALAGTYTQLLDPNTPSGVYLSVLQPDATNGWITMYALCFFFANFGPNSTTFIYPAELFPTKYKSRGHGFAAACGKAGAIIGAFGFLFASQPASGETTWSYPCQGPQYTLNPLYPSSGTALWQTRQNDLNTAASGGSCKVKNNCPTGRSDPGYPVTPCGDCIPKQLSGCYPYGIGVPASLAILAATNFLGMLFTFLLPETNQKTLEELNGTILGQDKVTQVEIFNAKTERGEEGKEDHDGLVQHF